MVIKIPQHKELMLNHIIRMIGRDIVRVQGSLLTIMKLSILIRMKKMTIMIRSKGIMQDIMMNKRITNEKNSNYVIIQLFWYIETIRIYA